MKVITEGPKVFLTGSMGIHSSEIVDYLRYAGHDPDDWRFDPGTSMLSNEILVEAAGRVCYNSFSKRRLGGTKAYVDHILEQGHGRVLEAAVFSFIFADISRACSHELYTHGPGWSKSMRSTRYVNETESAFVCPPDIKEGTEEYKDWELACCHAQWKYTSVLADLENRFGGSYDSDKVPTAAKKRARQAARYLLPHSLATTVFATVNARALRQFLEVRCHEAADVEIRQLGNRVYEKVLAAAPLLFGDYVRTDLPDGTYALSTTYRKV